TTKTDANKDVRRIRGDPLSAHMSRDSNERRARAGASIRGEMHVGDAERGELRGQPVVLRGTADRSDAHPVHARRSIQRRTDEGTAYAPALQALDEPAGIALIRERAGLQIQRLRGRLLRAG